MDNVWVKRPGKGGILAEHFNSVLGKTALIEIEEDSQIQWNYIK